MRRSSCDELLAQGFSEAEIAEAAARPQRRAELRAEGHTEADITRMIQAEQLAATINLAKTFEKNARRAADHPAASTATREQARAQARSFRALGQFANQLKSLPVTMVRPACSERRHRRAPGARPVRPRGSRRTSTTRAGPDEPPPDDDDRDDDRDVDGDRDDDRDVDAPPPAWLACPVCQQPLIEQGDDAICAGCPALFWGWAA